MKEWALYQGKTYRICGECMVDFAPGWILKTLCGFIRVEKSLVDAY